VESPDTFSDEGEKLPGLKLEVVSVPLMFAFPATLRFPPRLSPNAEILVGAEKSGGRITSGCVIVPLICGLEIWI
jgi:hypothetical protein